MPITAPVPKQSVEAGLFYDETSSGTYISGGTITPTGGVTFSVSPLIGYARNALGEMVRIEVNAPISGVCTNNGDNYISVDATGSIIVTATYGEADHIRIGYINTAVGNTVITGLSNIKAEGTDFNYHLINWMRNAVGTLVERGCNISLQSNPNELKVTLSSGILWAEANDKAIGDTSTFTKLFNSTNGYVADTATTANTISTAHWNNASNGYATALVPLTTSYWVKHIFFINPEGQLFFLYGTQEYALRDDALTAAEPPAPPSITTSIARVGAVIVQQGATSVDTLVDIRPILYKLFQTGTPSTPTTVIDINDLVGLTSDFAPQYLTDTRGDIRYNTKAEIVTLLTGKANSSHTHTISNVTGLSTALSDLDTGKADTTHSHVISDITGLSTALSGKEPSITAGSAGQYWAYDKTWKSLDPTAVGLSNVPNTDTTTTSNITDSTNKRFVTDAELVKLGNTSGTNSGDETQGTIKTKLAAATTSTDGYLTSTDWNTFNGKQAGAENLTQISALTKTNDDIIQVKAGAYTHRTPAQFKADLSLAKADVGLGSVSNTDTTTTTNITDSTNKRFVTDAELVKLGNTSGTNTGDETQGSIKTKLGAATTSTDGYLTSTDWNTFNGKQAHITATTAGDYYRGDKTFAPLNKTAVGLGNVANVNTTNASNIGSGTLDNARLSANLAEIGNETFADGEIIQNYGGTLQNASLGVGVTGAVEITNSAGQILFDSAYAKGPLNQKSGFFEDFITYSATVISPHLLRTVSGTGAGTSIGAALSSGDSRNGFIVFTTGTTSSGMSACASGGLSYINFANIPVNGYEEVGFRFAIQIVSDATQSFQVIAGFGDSASGLTPTDGAYITVGSGTTGFQGNTSSNSIRTNQGSLLATIANTNYVVRVRVSNIAGTLSASYFVNGSQLGTALTANIPSGAGRDMGIQFGIAKLVGTTARTVQLDWIYHESFKPRTINY
jgi:hypothetical protein